MKQFNSPINKLDDHLDKSILSERRTIIYQKTTQSIESINYIYKKVGIRKYGLYFFFLIEKKIKN